MKMGANPYALARARVANLLGMPWRTTDPLPPLTQTLKCLASVRTAIRLPYAYASASAISDVHYLRWQSIADALTAALADEEGGEEHG